ncbi:hypothetical protein PCCS19_19920 [Paenibacillus sp. CCS19]|uniref:hypothetical protein n=1 Tax=Paenibacillus sp. CCS19 TaxID=3158387 RepID=UPI0025687F0C|nr:hypothetical protein [Paenibacillus cellulosilyticus]GMK38938.1 hypothetical protein PCCS19_19920 [Paenibacillus cellulosilyticus]
MTKKSSPAWDFVQLNAAVADLRRDQYRILLTVGVLLDVLVERGLITREELENRTSLLDDELETLIDASLRPMG